MDKIGLIPEIVVRYRSPYFQHIFSGGYSAGYYSYIWSEVLDADAFQAFKETSLFDPKTARASARTSSPGAGHGGPDGALQAVPRPRAQGRALLKRKGFLKLIRPGIFRKQSVMNRLERISSS